MLPSPPSTGVAALTPSEKVQPKRTPTSALGDCAKAGAAASSTAMVAVTSDLFNMIDVLERWFVRRDLAPELAGVHAHTRSSYSTLRSNLTGQRAGPAMQIRQAWLGYEVIGSPVRLQ